MDPYLYFIINISHSLHQDWALGHFSDAFAVAAAYLLFVIVGSTIIKACDHCV